MSDQLHSHGIGSHDHISMDLHEVDVNVEEVCKSISVARSLLNLTFSKVQISTMPVTEERERAHRELVHQPEPVLVG